jgi:hypothetical protein
MRLLTGLPSATAKRRRIRIRLAPSRSKTHWPRGITLEDTPQGTKWKREAEPAEKRRDSPDLPHWIDRVADGIAAAFESGELPDGLATDLDEAILGVTNDHAGHAKDSARNLLPLALRRAIGLEG